VINVLFVDDDKVTQKIVKEILENSGYCVTTVSDPRDAIDRLNSEPFDVIITDANMPGGISGFDFCKTLRLTEKFAKIPIAMLTGRRETKDIQLGLESGADDYILKPIDPLILLGKVESLLKKKPGAIPDTKFSERTVRQRAQWPLDIEILYVSERGIVISCTLMAAADSKFRINSDFFAQIGIAPPLLRATSCVKDPSNSNIFHIKANFIGLGDSDLQKIRSWINTSAKKSA
jgi:DNA-binding response OmpR family regulator